MYIYRLLILKILIVFFITACGGSKKIDIKPFDTSFLLDKEENDKKSQACEASTQNPIIGFFNANGNSNDVDYYKVNFTLKNTSYKIIQSGVPGIDTRLTFYLPDGTRLFYVDRGKTGEAEVLWEYYPTTDYILMRVESKGGYNDTVPYVINFIPKLGYGINEIEPNNSKDKAVLIKIGEEKSGLISPKDDVDFYKITFEENETENFSIKLETLSNLDINFTLINEKLNNNKYINNFGWGQKEFYPFLNSQKGVYYIRVSGSIKSSDRDDPVYYLKLEKNLDKKDDTDIYYEAEYNDDKENPTELVDGYEIIGAFFPDNDKDWFKFDLYKDPLSVDLSLSRVRGVDPVIELYDNNFNLIKVINDEDMDGGESVKLNDMIKGRYYVKIYSANKSLQEYRLFFNVRYK